MASSDIPVKFTGGKGGGGKAKDKIEFSSRLFSQKNFVPKGGKTIGNDPNGICGIVIVGVEADAWAVGGLNGVKLKTGAVAEAEEEDGGFIPADEGAWAKSKKKWF